jgi:hypothetical protein
MCAKSASRKIQTPFPKPHGVWPLSAQKKDSVIYDPVFNLFTNLNLLLLEKFFPPKSCKTDKASTQKEHGGGFGNGFTACECQIIKNIKGT